MSRLNAATLQPVLESAAEKRSFDSLNRIQESITAIDALKALLWKDVEALEALEVVTPELKLANAKLTQAIAWSREMRAMRTRGMQDALERIGGNG